MNDFRTRIARGSARTAMRSRSRRDGARMTAWVTRHEEPREVSPCLLESCPPASESSAGFPLTPDDSLPLLLPSLTSDNPYFFLPFPFLPPLLLSFPLPLSLPSPFFTYDNPFSSFSLPFTSPPFLSPPFPIPIPSLPITPSPLFLSPPLPFSSLPYLSPFLLGYPFTLLACPLHFRSL